MSKYFPSALSGASGESLIECAAIQETADGDAASSLGVRLSAARSPWQNPFVERVIASLRRERLDHVIVVNENHLRRILKSYSKSSRQ
jgi:hypothetical protein